MYIHDEGYILRSINLKESDKLYTIYSREIGKFEARARGVRKPKSKLSGHLQTLSRISLHIARGKSVYHIIGAQLDASYGFRISSRTLGYGYYFLESVDKLTRLGQKSDEISNLLDDAFELLNTTKDEEKLKILRIVFLLKLIKITGFSPEKRVSRNKAVKQELEYCMSCDLVDSISGRAEPVIKNLFHISQYSLNEITEKPLRSAKYLQLIT